MIIKPKVLGDKISGDYKVRFFYLDTVNGKLDWQILTKYVDSGGTVNAPTIPTSLSAVSKDSCALEFVEWNNTNFTNITQDLDIGATYRNSLDGGIRKTHAFIVVTANTGYTVPIYFNKSDTSTLTISWGDGSANYTTTSSGNVNTSHVYSTDGTYEIKMWISSGTGNYKFSNGSSSTGFIGGNTASYKRCLKSLFIGDNVTTLNSYGLYNQYNLRLLNIPTNITSIATYSVGSIRSLRNIVLSSSCTTIIDSAFSYNSGLENLILGYGTTTIGNSICTENDTLEGLILPNTVTSLGTTGFEACENLKKFIFSNQMTSIPGSCFYYCTGLDNIEIPNNITSLAAGSFLGCSNLREITLSSFIESIGDAAFYNCLSLQVLTIQRYTAPSTITTLGTDVFVPNNTLRIYVPVGSLAVYQGATNWSTYANRMYEDTPENRALFGD